jgi:hypothetical protein
MNLRRAHLQVDSAMRNPAPKATFKLPEFCKTLAQLRL